MRDVGVVDAPQSAASLRRRRPAHAAVLALMRDEMPTAEPFIGRYEVTRTAGSAMPSELTAAVASQRTAVVRAGVRLVTGRVTWKAGGGS